METELLRTFLEVHRMRSFTRAAENLCLTPSAVSARVRQLESELGRPLFKTIGFAALSVVALVLALYGMAGLARILRGGSRGPEGR